MKRNIVLSCALLISFLWGCSGSKPEENQNQSDTLAVSEFNDQESTAESSSVLTSDQVYRRIEKAFQSGDMEDAESAVRDNNFNIDAYETASYFGQVSQGTYLYRFALANNRKAVKFLLDHGVDPNKPGACIGEEGCNIEFATSCDEEVSSLLLKAGSKAQLDNMVICRSDEQDVEGMKGWIKKGANPNGAIAYAVRNLMGDFILELARGGADKDKIIDQINGIEKKDSTLAPTIQALVSMGADPTRPLAYAIGNQINGLTNYLLNAGANKDRALFYSAEYERMELARKLISQGAHLQEASRVVYSDNEELKTLVLEVTRGMAYSELKSGMEGSESSDLLMASREDKLQAVEFMLKSGADPNVYCEGCVDYISSNPCEMSALGLARKNGNAEMVALLKKYGAKLPGECN